MNDLTRYATLLQAIKQRIGEAQTSAMLAVNAELIHLYWDIGRLIAQRQQQEGWSAGVIPRLALDLKNELPEVKGFSERNLGRMVAFFRAYPDPERILPQAVAKFDENRQAPQSSRAVASSELLWHIPWGHHALLLEKVKEQSIRQWYMQQIIAQGWSRNTLALYALRGMNKPIGVSEYELTRALPDELKSSLPTIEELEAELSGTPNTIATQEETTQ